MFFRDFSRASSRILILRRLLSNDQNKVDHDIKEWVMSYPLPSSTTSASLGMHSAIFWAFFSKTLISSPVR